MVSDIRSMLEGKKVLILGYGREGQSTYRLLRSWFPTMPLCIADRDEDIGLSGHELQSDEYATVVAGEQYLDRCGDYDLVIKSPGLPYALVSSKVDPARITSQTDLFMRAHASRVIGVTGTKGKSTVTSLIHHILASSGRNAVLAGNIGVPPLDAADSIDEDTLVVFEMSSHQLEHISIAPQTAVILNVFPEHLDHYRDFTAYKMAKFNIAGEQPEGGCLVYNADDPIIGELIRAQKTGKKMLSFSLGTHGDAHASFDGSRIICRAEDGSILHFPIANADMPGRHNVANMMAAVLVCMIIGLAYREILEGIETYRRLPHRLEYSGTFRGISFYDDSIATIPEASIEALKTLGKVDMLILGGFDRGLEYHGLREWISTNTVPHLVFMGEAGKRMYSEWHDKLPDGVRCHNAGSMQEAFEVVIRVLGPGDVCLLSPAAASYGMFRNFEERGDVFKKMAASL